jgi:hypothetical protein
MPATVTIRRWTGAAGAPTKTNITGINTRANAEDAHSTAGVTNPVQIPATGTNYSYWVCTRLSADTAPAGTINNLRWYSDGANNLGTGITCKGNEATAYTQASGTIGLTGAQLTTTNYASITTPASVFTFTSAAPKSLTGSISNPNTGDFGSFFVYQGEVGASANLGVSGQETFTWKYDET